LNVMSIDLLSFHSILSKTLTLSTENLSPLAPESDVTPPPQLATAHRATPARGAQTSERRGRKPWEFFGPQDSLPEGRTAEVGWVMDRMESVKYGGERKAETRVARGHRAGIVRGEEFGREGARWSSSGSSTGIDPQGTIQATARADNSGPSPVKMSDWKVTRTW